jgi:tyrosyl-tRNA synthetase
MASLHNQLKSFMVSVEDYAKRRGYMREWAWKKALDNNVTWWSNTTARDFLFVLGRHIRLGPMLGRDT